MPSRDHPESDGFASTSAALNDDCDSELSDPRTDLDMMDSEYDTSPTPGSRKMKQLGRHRRSDTSPGDTQTSKKRRRLTHYETTDEEDTSTGDVTEDGSADSESQHEVVLGDISQFESLPKEVRHISLLSIL